MKDEESDFVDEIVQSKLPQHTSPARDDFQPWHKVRKQFIREKQWNLLVSEMVRRYLKRQLQTDTTDWLADEEESDRSSEIPEGVILDRPLRCLVIPGDDLLDLRSLYKDTRPFNCYIKYLGFNQGQGSDQKRTRVDVANNEVTSLKEVASNSTVAPDQFQSIASTKSQAYRYMKDYGPFHVVNLDLCDSLFPSLTVDAKYYSAIHRLAEYQMKSQTVPWLLFITTQIEPSQVSVPDFSKMCTPTQHNLRAHPDFAERLASVLPPEALQDDGAIVVISQLNDEQMIFVFGVALGKWLISLGATSSPTWVVEMLRSYRYAIRRDPFVEMLSLAFQFLPKFSPPIDKTGLSKLFVSASQPSSELDSALKLLTAVGKIGDVDLLLKADPDLCSAMEKASADLLESAGYDRERYLEWQGRYYD